MKSRLVPWLAPLHLLLLLFLQRSVTAAATCVENLAVADANQDGFLSSMEFATVLQLESECPLPSDSTSSSLSTAQQGLYLAAVAAQCGLLDFGCLSQAPSAELDINGAAVEESSRTQDQQAALEAICGTVQVIGVVECALNDNEQEPNSSNAYSINVQVVQPCFDGSITATVTDANGEPLVDTLVSFLLVGNADYVGDVSTNQQGVAVFDFTADALDDGQDLWCSVAVQNLNTGNTDQVPCSVTVCGDSTSDTTTENNINQDNCIQNLVQADADGDEQLTRQEFAVLLQLQSNCSDVNDLLDLTAAQQAIYLAAVTTQCVATGGRLQCFLDLSDRTLAMDGAALDPTQRSGQQTNALNTLCSTVSVLTIAECLGGGGDVLPDIGGQQDFDACATALEQADVDQSDDLTRTEFKQFIADLNGCNTTDTSDSTSELSLAEEAIFSTAACTDAALDSTTFDKTNCWMDQSVTVNVSSAALDSTVRLAAICIPSNGLDCDSSPAGELDAQCIGVLTQADTDQDEFLSLQEFSLLLQIQTECPLLDSFFELDGTNEAVYTAAVTAQCFTTQTESSTDCLADIGNRTLSIQGATAANDALTSRQKDSLQAVCDTVNSLRVAECPMLGLDDESKAKCTDALNDADLDGSGSLGRLEYRFFLNNWNDCSDLIVGLDLAEQVVFASMSCLSDPSLDCLTTPLDAKMDFSNPALLPTICLATQQLPCRETGVTVPDLPAGEVVPDLTQDCVDDIQAVDVDQNGEMTVGEYTQLVVLRATTQVETECDVDLDYVLDTTQTLAFQGLGCTSCVAAGESPTCCLTSSDTATLEIADAAIDVSTQRGAFFTSICVAAEQGGYTVSCPGKAVNGQPTAAPAETCLEQLEAADANQDGFLDMDEFYGYVVSSGTEYCYESGGALSGTMTATFQTFACASCTAAGEGILCCTKSIEEARVTLSKATGSTVACAAVDAEVSQSTCGGTQSPTPAITETPNGSPTERGPVGTTSGSSFVMNAGLVSGLLALLCLFN